jgi:hypothetical protein
MELNIEQREKLISVLIELLKQKQSLEDMSKQEDVERLYYDLINIDIFMVCSAINSVKKALTTNKTEY